jgi:hypothetical protein
MNEGLSDLDTILTLLQDTQQLENVASPLPADAGTHDGSNLKDNLKDIPMIVLVAGSYTYNYDVVSFAHFESRDRE